MQSETNYCPLDAVRYLFPDISAPYSTNLMILIFLCVYIHKHFSYTLNIFCTTRSHNWQNVFENLFNFFNTEIRLILTILDLSTYGKMC